MKQLILLLGVVFLFGNTCCRPNAAPEMPGSRNAAVSDTPEVFLRQYFEEVWGKHDFDLARQKYWHPEVHNAYAPEILPGPDGMMQQVNAFLSGFPDARIEPEPGKSVLVDGNVVAARVMLSGTHRGNFMGIEASGKKISVRELAFVELKDGKLWRFYPLVDVASLLEQIKTTD